MEINFSYEKEFNELLDGLAKKYPLELFDLEGIGKQLDINNFSKEFFKTKTTVADSSVDANSNVDDLTMIAYNTELPKPFLRLNSFYLIWRYARRLYTLEIANKLIENQLNGTYYINDATGIAQPYCFNFSVYDVMQQGLPFVKKISSEPPKHLSSFMGQMIHFSVYASNSVLGAVGLADLLIVMSYYVKKMLNEDPDVPEAYKWRQVKQELQSFIFSCNQPFRGGVQSGFYNLSIFDDYFLDKMCSEYVFPDFSNPDKELIKKLQVMYLDLMNETLRKTVFTFPVTTACFSVDDKRDILDQDFLKMITEKNKEFGFINIYAGKTSTLSSCCRLRSDMDNPYFNQFGAGGTKIGSLGVVTLSLPHIAYQANGDFDAFFKLLREHTDQSIRINNIKRHLVKKRIDAKALPLYPLGFMDLNKQYSTTGICGVNEACEIMGVNILKESGQKFVTEILDTINAMNDKATKYYGAPHNMEQTPSENSAIKLASKDRVQGLQNKYALYSNQFIPLVTNADLLDRIYLQGLFDSKMSGGAVCHLHVENRIEDTSKMAELIKLSAKLNVVYMAINYNLQKCEDGHISVGKATVCPVCGKPITDNYLRVVGFIVNTKNFHKVRREHDYPNRVFYEKAINE